MTSVRLARWRSVTLSLLGIVVSAGLLLRSASLVEEHALLIKEVGQEGLPLAAGIPALEDRKALLLRQLDVTKLASSTRLGSLREQLHAYVLPAHPVDRFVAALTDVTEGLRAKGEIGDMAPLEVGQPEALDALSGSTLHRQKVTLTLDVSADGMRALEQFTNLTGLLTVADVLTPAQTQDLLTQTERENPTGVVALSQFFATDLAKYLQDQSSYDRRLLSEFSASAFSEHFSTVMQSPFFSDESGFLRGDIGQHLLQQKLWPLPFAQIVRADLAEASDGFEHVTLLFDVYGQ